MIFSIFSDYIHAIIIDKNRNNIKSKIALISSIVINLSLLAFFKYSNFIMPFEVIMPIGISFYTFQTMSYSIDVYRNKAPVQKNIISLATYVTLFPQLVAGPIVRYIDVAKDLNKRTHSLNKFYDGTCLFIVGLSKKVLLANSLGFIWFNIKNSSYGELSILTAWLGIICFTLQIYFDFSGYSDMAIGLGKMFGFTFLENFNYPYISKSITEFWRRWHMSLGIWFRDYVYIPLGGNRCSKSRWLFNIIVVWFLTGLWHGASFNFIMWGLYFGFILILEKTFILDLLKKLPNFISHIYVIVLVIISVVLFDIENMNNVFKYYKAMFNLTNPLIDSTFWYYFVPNIPLLIISIMSCTPLFKNIFSKHIVLNYIFLMLGLVLSTSFLIDSTFNPFLYFRF